ncbi:hypothetical protein [Mycobacterium sp. PSTR-4-N]|uniref:hypothetical protein n=1 Tax=Mycobacterium sp. PSTR-4-N TaxID=2917745 RepID=UPI001F1519C2|nr:hypothetical protein [Mycobacterium sp. PSTR-4-N]MCG7594758.1 hypothetical protein [Mycobacterium sp. PSTR-4-N]
MHNRQRLIAAVGIAVALLGGTGAIAAADEGPGSVTVPLQGPVDPPDVPGQPDLPEPGDRPDGADAPDVPGQPEPGDTPDVPPPAAPPTR